MPLVVDPDAVEIETIRGLVDVDRRRVLEVGCGDGRVTLQYARNAASVFAFDSDEESIRAARAALPGDLADRVRFEAAHAAEVELPEGEFDLALFSWSL